MNKFKFLIGDVNCKEYGGKWYREVDNLRYHVVELINMVDATDEEDQPTYNVELHEIDFTCLTSLQIEECVKSCGWITDDKPLDNLMVLEAIDSYGHYAPLMSLRGNNYLTLLTQAKRYSYTLESDDQEYENAMNRPVNRLGSTAREFQAGDFITPLIRGIVAGDKNACLMGRIQGLSQDDIKNIQSNFIE